MGEEPRTSEDLTEENVTIRQGQGKPEVTTFGPFSAFKNFPSFPDGVLENQQDQLLELRGPNLLPTKPTPPPSSRVSEASCRSFVSRSKRVHLLAIATPEREGA